MNLKHPCKALLILLVGRAQYFETLESLREMALCLSRLLSQQCKIHTSQKIHQSLHLYSCYSRMWGEEVGIYFSK